MGKSAVSSVSACVQAFVDRREGDIRCETRDKLTTKKENCIPKTKQQKIQRQKKKNLSAQSAASFGVYCFGASLIFFP